MKFSLYDRMGGDSFISLMVSSYFDELAEDKELGKFFRHVPMKALKQHQIKFFYVCFGPQAANPDELIDYLLITHTRLFRDLYMDETHFDKVAGCFVRSLQTFQVDQSLIDEAVSLLAPLRPVFARGAEIARREKELGSINDLPVAQATTLEDPQDQRLPEYPCVIPKELPNILSRVQKHPTKIVKCLPLDQIVRGWTCALTDAWMKDCLVADTFIDMAFLHHHVYAVAVLELAFLPVTKTTLQTVLYPRGPTNPALSQELFGRMVTCFVKVCIRMRLDQELTQKAEQQLRGLAPKFAKQTAKVGTTLHTIHPGKQAVGKMDAAKTKKNSKTLKKQLSSTSSESNVSNGESVVRKGLFRLKLSKK